MLNLCHLNLNSLSACRKPNCIDNINSLPQQKENRSQALLKRSPLTATSQTVLYNFQIEIGKILKKKKKKKKEILLHAWLPRKLNQNKR